MSKKPGVKPIEVRVTDDSMFFSFGETIVPLTYLSSIPRGEAIFASNLEGDWEAELRQLRFDERLNRFIEQLAKANCDTIEVHFQSVKATAAPTAAIGPRAIESVKANFDRPVAIRYKAGLGRPLHATSGFQGL